MFEFLFGYVMGSSSGGTSRVETVRLTAAGRRRSALWGGVSFLLLILAFFYLGTALSIAGEAVGTWVTAGGDEFLGGVWGQIVHTAVLREILEWAVYIILALLTISHAARALSGTTERIVSGP